MVTGLGVISPLGNDPDALFSRLMAAESGIRLMSADGPRGQYSNIAAPVIFDPAQYFSPQQKIDHLDRVSQFSIAVAAMAVKDSAIQFTDDSKRRAGGGVRGMMLDLCPVHLTLKNTSKPRRQSGT